MELMLKALGLFGQWYVVWTLQSECYVYVKVYIFRYWDLQDTCLYVSDIPKHCWTLKNLRTCVSEPCSLSKSLLAFKKSCIEHYGAVNYLKRHKKLFWHELGKHWQIKYLSKFELVHWIEFRFFFNIVTRLKSIV